MLSRNIGFRQVSRLKVLLFLLLLGVIGFCAVVSWRDYVQNDPVARQAETTVSQFYSSIPTPPFAKRVDLQTWHKPHAAGIIAIYKSSAGHDQVSKFYGREFAKRHWRVCVIEQYHVFERDQLASELDFPPAAPGTFIFRISWGDGEPIPSCHNR